MSIERVLTWCPKSYVGELTLSIRACLTLDNFFLKLSVTLLVLHVFEYTNIRGIFIIFFISWITKIDQSEGAGGVGQNGAKR